MCSTFTALPSPTTPRLRSTNPSPRPPRLTFGLERAVDGQIRLPIVIPFSSLWTPIENPSVTLYRGSPLSELSTYIRGKVIEATAMKIEARVGYAVAAPRAMRGGRGAYDWHREGTDERVECKSSLLHWDTFKHRSSGMWRVKFQNIKWKEFDVLYLCIFLPQGLFYYLYEGNKDNRVEANSRSKSLLFGAAAGDTNAVTAFETLEHKMAACCRFVGAVYF